MLKHFNKGGQFYLIAAVIISIVVIGISIVPNYIKKTQNLEFNDLKEEIPIEAEKTIDYGTKNNFNNAQMYFLMQNFMSQYIQKRLNNESLYFIFGTSNNLSISGFQDENRTVTAQSGGTPSVITTNIGNFSGSIVPASGSSILNLTIDTDKHSFGINNGYNFNFVILQKKGEEIYVAEG